MRPVQQLGLPLISLRVTKHSVASRAEFPENVRNSLHEKGVGSPGRIRTSNISVNRRMASFGSLPNAVKHMKVQSTPSFVESCFDAAMVL
jgi:hypothetical protein